MKRCINTIVATIALSLCSYTFGSQLTHYTIIPTTVGDNAIVNAIKQYSNITQAYVNKWKPFNVWIIGSSLRSGVIDAINNYIRVCKSLKLAHVRFEDEASLRSAFPINWTLGALCAALKNLKEQGMNALALIAQVGVNSNDVKGLDDIITSYIAIIDHNRNVLKPTCTELMKKRMEKQEKIMKNVLAQAEIEEKKWDKATAQVKIVEGVETLASILTATGDKSSQPKALLGMALFYLANKAGVFNALNTLVGNE